MDLSVNTIFISIPEIQSTLLIITYIFLFIFILPKTLIIILSIETYRYYTYMVYFNNRLHYIHKHEKIGINNKLNDLNGIN